VAIPCILVSSQRLGLRYPALAPSVKQSQGQGLLPCMRGLTCRWLDWTRPVNPYLMNISCNIVFIMQVAGVMANVTASAAKARQVADLLQGIGSHWGVSRLYRELKHSACCSLLGAAYKQWCCLMTSGEPSHPQLYPAIRGDGAWRPHCHG
jgi:hypothetical protein